MPVTYQRVLVSIIWALTLADAAREGWSVPRVFAVSAGQPNHSLATLNWSVVWFGLLVPPAMALLRALIRRFMPSRSHRASRISVWVDRRWGTGTMAMIMGRLQPKWLMVCATFVLGVSALWACEYYNAASLPFHAAMFCLAAGIGLGVGFLLERQIASL